MLHIEGRVAGVSDHHLEELFEGLPARLTVKQLADALGLTQKAVYRYLGTGDLPAYRVGDKWIILRDEVIDALAATRKPRPEGDDELDDQGGEEPGAQEDES